VRFVWRGSETRAKVSLPDLDLNTALTVLPTAERAAMHHAVVTGDLSAITARTRQWSDRRLAMEVDRLVESFALTRLEQLLAPIQVPPSSETSP
jgi:hypothetical protein